MTTIDQQAALEKVKATVAYFLELQFADGTVRVCTYSNTYTWDGYEWTGLGSIGNISPMDESAGVASNAMIFSLNITQVSLLALALSASSNYRGLLAKLYFSPLTEHGALIDTPEICWSGIMDSMTVAADGETGQIALRCETSSYGLKRRPSLRINDAQQKQRHPTDTAFIYLNDLIAQPQMWLSKKFQQI